MGLTVYDWYVANHHWTVPLTFAAPGYIVPAIKAAQKFKTPLIFVGSLILVLLTLGWYKRKSLANPKPAPGNEVLIALLSNLLHAKLPCEDSDILVFKKLKFGPKGKVECDGKMVELTWGERWRMSGAYNQRMTEERSRLREEGRMAAACV
jgi:hypothetical protein